MRRDLLAWPGAPLAIASAALFGASTPFAKFLLGEGISPWLLAGLLYLGSGIGLGIVHLGTPCGRPCLGGSAAAADGYDLAGARRVKRRSDRTGPADDRFDDRRRPRQPHCC